MAHEIDSTMLYIHPPLAIIGYAFIIISLFLVIAELNEELKKKLGIYPKFALYFAWFFTLLGLATGMFWAQLSWGSYWNWDPKENATLIIFVTICLSVLFYEKQRKVFSILFIVLSLIAVLINILITLGNYGLHSYGFF
jgi:cytochrome c biogenesis factor